MNASEAEYERLDIKVSGECDMESDKHSRACEGESGKVSRLQPVNAARKYTQHAVEEYISSFPPDSVADPSSLQPIDLKDPFVPGFKQDRRRNWYSF